MFYLIRNNKISFQQEIADKEDDDCFLGIFPMDEINEASQKFHLEEQIFEDVAMNKTAKFESFDGFDFICLNILDYENLYVSQRRVFIYLKKEMALFFCEDVARVQAIIEECTLNKSDNITFNRIIYNFYNKLTIGDTKIFDSIEKEIMSLEKALMTSKKRDCVKEIISLRKRLMILKKYYEQFLDVLDDVQENENAILDKKTLRYFRVLQNRIDRLYHNVLNLRDYVTQVREAYQAEVDISLNETMKLFTVITAIFLPLSLIAAWYGMNFQMPEYSWSHGYSMVIGISLIIVVILVAYFKKNKWF